MDGAAFPPDGDWFCPAAALAGLRWKGFLSAFHHFCQKLGTALLSALVVIAFQGLVVVFLFRARRPEDSCGFRAARAPVQKRESGPRPALREIDHGRKKMFKAKRRDFAGRSACRAQTVSAASKRSGFGNGDEQLMILVVHLHLAAVQFPGQFHLLGVLPPGLGLHR